MTWITYALLAAIGTGIGDALFKYLLKRDDEYVVAWMRAVFIVPVVVIGLFLLGPFRITREFWLLGIIILPVDILAFLLYLKAIRLSALSISLPFLAFSPIFVIFISWMILGEQVSAVGFLGVFFIVLGSYVLNIKHIRNGFFEPILAIFREPGPKIMLLVAFLYGLDAVLGKQMMHLSEPKFFALIYPVFLFLSFTPIVYYRIKHKISRANLSFHRLILYFLVSFIFAITIVLHFKAVTLAFTAYAIAVKRTSILIGSVLGFLIFKERNVKSRLAGVGLMLAGVFLIGFYA